MVRSLRPEAVTLDHEPHGSFRYKERYGEFNVYKRLPNGKYEKMAIAESKAYAEEIVNALIFAHS